MDLADIGKIEINGGPLGPLEITVWDADFSDWIRNRAEAALAGAGFTRALLGDRVRKAGDDAPLGAETVAGLDEAALETLAEAIFMAGGEMLRPRYIETGPGRRKQARRRRSDEAFPMAREPEETSSDRLARVLVALADDRRLSSRALLDAATGLHGSLASVLDAHKATAGSLYGGLASLTAPNGAMRSVLEDMKSSALQSALHSMKSPVRREALDLARTMGSLGVADRAFQGALGLSGHGAAVGGLLSEIGAIGRFTELSGRAAELARSMSGYAPGQRLIDQTLFAGVTKGLNASLDPTRRAAAGIAGQLSGYGAILEATRMSRWSESVAGRSIAEITQALRPNATLFAEVERMRADARQITQGAQALAFFGAGNIAGPAALAATSLKMSALAGARDVFGSLSAVEGLANRALLGGWATRADLPERFWSEPSYRSRLYRDAEVDEGLIETSAGGAIDVMVTSGLHGGVRDQDGVTALVLPVGSLLVSIRSDNVEGDARQAVADIERAMRAFVARKLEAAHGPDWVRHRTPGDIFKNAKRKREAALKDGEPNRPLVDFVDIGELMDTVIWAKNWASVFADVFIDAQMFALRVRALNAVRRPAAHSREVDGVQLVELCLQAYRLAAQMKADGAWKIAAQSDV
ncbi:MAG: hypothetical protein DI565_02680 [Ancylobacter novellus]|uniref:Swt1-like HEPN domain-containing protein n=1 Tax=Ancylobacter novellus TaxID=921 RepID=A0A2W5KT37_ANCNO|nr:MAG: hypothetical protein DI565_02680 [Ancylobacter novellus]